MAEIISLDNKLQISKQKKSELARKRKLIAVKKVFQCTHRFCESCAEEYIEYIERLKGRGNPECYWHNAEWLDLWQKWIDYQGALDRYMKSKAFAKLLNELKQTHPEE